MRCRRGGESCCLIDTRNGVVYRIHDQLWINKRLKMSPTSKNAKVAEQIKHVHSEQLKKLQAKHQQDADLLEDTRLFAKQRSVIEKEYAQALVKLGETFLHKRKFPPPPDVKSQDHKIIMAVWKTVLEETVRVGRTRLNAAESYLVDISEPAKPLRTSKLHMAKKVFDQAQSAQKDVGVSVVDLTKAYKGYADEEHVAHEVRVKSADADHKVKNKSTSIFTSMAKLQQKSAKLTAQRDTCETKSTGARNDYLLNLASTNAHLNYYFNSVMPELMNTLDGELYEKVSEFFMTSAKAELECCGLTQECFMRILSDSTMVSREYNLQCFLSENPAFTEVLQFEFDGQDNDEVTKVCAEYGAKDTLVSEAEDCAQKLASQNKTIRCCERQLQEMHELKKTQEAAKKAANGSGSKNVSESSEGKEEKEKEPKEKEKDKKDKGAITPTDPDVMIEELRIMLRKANTEKAKLEARIDALQHADVDIDSLVERAEAEMRKVEDAEEAMSASKPVPTHSRNSSKGGDSHKSRPQSEAIDAAPQTNTSTPSASVSQAPSDSTYINYKEEDYVDETFDDGGGGLAAASAGNAYNSGSYAAGYPYKAYALYEFQASNQDELGIRENEFLEIVSAGDSAGWLRARKDTGEEGFIPENYVQAYDEAAMGVVGVVDPNEVNVDSGAPMSAGWDPTQPAWGDTPLPQTAGYISVDTSAPMSAGYDSVPPSAGFDSSGAPMSAGYDSVPGYDVASAGYDTVPSYDVTAPNGATVAADQEVEAASTQHQLMPPGPGMWARALYDYDATCDEELTFSEGSLLQILRQVDDQGVDDGWWEGTINGRVGVFPSLVVEEITGQDLQQGAVTPGDRPGPPAFTPPEPGPPPPQIEVQDPTPNEETPPEGTNGKTATANPSNNSNNRSNSSSKNSNSKNTNYGVCNLYEYNMVQRHESTV